MIWADDVPDDPASPMAMFRVFAGLGVGGVLAGVLLYLLHKQAAAYQEQLKIVRKERREDIARLERRIDLILRELDIPPPKEDADE